MNSPIVKIDARGRVAVGRHIRKNALEPAAYYSVTFGTYGTIILTPVDQEARR